jgi:hypothetical protein
VLKLNLEDDPELAMALAQLRLNEGKSWKPKIRSLIDNIVEIHTQFSNFSFFCC